MSKNKFDNNAFESNAGTFGIVVFYLSFLLIFPIFFFILSRNKFLRIQQQVHEISSDINVQLKKRYDLLTKLTDSTKQYIKYEAKTLIEITNLRTKLNNLNESSSINNLQENVNNNLDDLYKRINAVIENYPDLKANENVLKLQSVSESCEENIAAARRFYNAVVRIFNSRLKTWPTNVTGRSLHLKSFSYFDVDNEIELEDVKIDLMS